ncbi:threonine/homoserine efflux transporter RhtA [Dongia mobilis]|uniref:Threonine/homoserine efflux transporter RhtA n=1 Tax=Dongia mobilis TaxID=578943 RepID=A0A4R6WTI1_9PROT|nr:DMT family transporter [Dongia mobilis]TDQ83348.1 threonine/homoserine efflux transporter RhtA [Dongia mobilis]
MNTTAAPRMAAEDWLLLVILSALWGGSFLFAKIAVAELPPLTLAWCRVALSAMLLLPLLRLAGIALPRDAAFWRDIAMMGLFNNAIPFSLIFWGQQGIGAGLAAILNAMTPVFTVLVAHAFTADERLGWWKLLGVALGVAGVVLMMGYGVLAGLGHHLAAEFAVLGAAFSYGIAGVFGRRFKARPPMTVAAGQLSASSCWLALPVLWLDRPWQLDLPGRETILAVLALAALSTALAYVIFFRILRRAGATNLSLVTLLIPASAILLGWAVLGENVAAHHLAGIGLIALGLVAIDGRLPRLILR